MVILFGLLVTMFAIYMVAKLVYQGEQEQTSFSKSVTGLGVVAIVLILLFTWLEVYNVNKEFTDTAEKLKALQPKTN